MGLVGYFFRSETRVVQFRKDEFTLNQLAPYPGFDVVTPEARRLWSVFRELVRPTGVTRIALRFINRLSFPAERLRFEDLLEHPPRVPDGLPEAVQRYRYEMVVPVRESSSGVRVLVVTEGVVRGNLSILVDVDAFNTPSDGSSDLTDELFLETLQGLRRLKNDAFFGTLTESAIRDLE